MAETSRDRDARAPDRAEVVTLGDGELIVDVIPDVGARLHRIRWRDGDLVQHPTAADDHRSAPFTGGGYVMAPWCNRMATGPQRVLGRTVDLPASPGDSTALHGLVHDAPFTTIAPGRFARIDGGPDTGWPWRHRVVVAYSVTGPMLEVTLSLENLDDGAMPGGIGLHPWFCGPLELSLQPTAIVEDNTSLDPAPLGVVDRAWAWLHGGSAVPAGLDLCCQLGRRTVSVVWSGLGVAAEIEIGTKGPPWLAVASFPDLGVAVEPQTHAPAGLARLLAGADGAMGIVEPGECLELALTLRFADADRAGRA